MHQVGISTGQPQSQLPQQHRLLDALREIGRAINAAWDVETTLDLITRQTAQVMGMDSCSIYLLDSTQDALVLKATTGLNRDAIGQAHLQVGEGITGWAVQHGQPVAVSDAARDPRFKFLPETGESRFASLLAVPLVNQGRVIGAINVQTGPQHVYSEGEIELLSLIGDLAAGALEKAILYERLQHRIAELSVLAEASKAATSSIYLEDILGLIVEMAARTMNAKICSLVLFDEADGELLIRARPNFSAEYVRRPARRPGEGIAGVVAQTGQPLAVLDVRIDPRYRDREQARRDGLCSLLAVPLVIRDRVIGVLRIYTETPHEFSPEELELLTTLANQTALAIDNANLVVKAAVVQEMHHRVKNNLQTVAMFLRLQMSDPKAGGAREVLGESVNRILSIAAVHEILSEKGLGMIDVKDLIGRVAQETARNMARPGQQIQVDVAGDPVQLPSQPATAVALVVNELVQNAIEHGFEGRVAGRVAITLHEGADRWSVEVCDDGAGLPADFDLEVTDNLGLEIVKTLVRDDLRGELRLTSEGGTKACIVVPKTT